MKIAVCDDEIQVARELASIVAEVCNNINMPYDVHVYSSGIKLIEDIRIFDMVFLDIHMEELDGIKVGRLIKLYNPECLIIMATGEEDRYKEAFEIGAKGFVSKPFDENEVKRAIKMARLSEKQNKEIDVYNNRVRVSINIKSIKYCMAYNGYVVISTTNGEYRKDTSLKELDRYLCGRDFYRVSRNCIVNMKWINRYLDGDIYIDNIVITVAKKKTNDFYKIYSHYDSKNAR